MGTHGNDTPLFGGSDNPEWKEWYKENRDKLTPCPECHGAGFFGTHRHKYSCGTCHGVGYFTKREGEQQPA